ncbi:MAG: Mfa1 fimbrilin C-terminal domain-containing protein [Tannerellaceae bacterium]|nr:Mfa1 fimbrilin C-terminal domain-containing protein [Tannerellaceae bacterium]
MKHKHFTTKTVLYLIGVLFYGFAFTECTDDPDVRRIINPDETCISVTLQHASFTTRSGEDIENTIGTLHVLTFEKNTQTGSYHYLRRKEMDEQGENKFEANLLPTENAVKLLFIANFSDFSSITLNDTEEQVRTSLTKAFTDQPAENLPMFSELEYPDGLLSGEIVEEQLTLLRSMAKVSVALSEDRNDWNSLFELVSIQAYRAGNQLQIIPNAGAMHATELKVTETSIPEATAFNLTTPSLTEAGTTPVYLPESAPWGDNEITDVTCLIIGGIYKEGISNPKVTYYRIDFNGKDENEAELFGYILRNHHYKITIDDVDGPGTTHPEEAGESGSANLSVTVTDWDINDEIIYGEGGSDDPLYFGLSGREIVLPWYKNAQNTVVVKTNVDNYRIVWYENENNENQPLASAGKGGSITTEHFIIEHHDTCLVLIKRKAI